MPLRGYSRCIGKTEVSHRQREYPLYHFFPRSHIEIMGTDVMDVATTDEVTMVAEADLAIFSDDKSVA